MNNKQLIQIVVICVAFAGAGFVLYKGGLFGQSSVSSTTSSLSKSVESLQPILPYGESLDLKQVILPDRFEYKQYEFNKVLSNEIGVDANQLITPMENP